MRRAKVVAGKIGRAYISSLIEAAGECPSCGVTLSDTQGLPTSKHVDHIVPLCIGGRHERSNLRVLCATCNMTRPNDGSDLHSAVAIILPMIPKARRAKASKTKPYRDWPASPEMVEAVWLSLEGHGYKAIASKIGVSRDRARRLVVGLRDRRLAMAA